MSLTRLIAATAMAAVFLIDSSPNALANSDINEARKLRHDYCRNDVPDSWQSQCMKQTRELLRIYRSEYRDCLRDPGKDTVTCDDELAANLESLLRPINGQI